MASMIPSPARTHHHDQESQDMCRQTTLTLQFAFPLVQTSHPIFWQAFGGYSSTGFSVYGGICLEIVMV